MKKESKKSIATISFILALVIIIAAGLIWFFMENGNEKQTHTDTSTSSSYINCTATQPENPFFSSELASNAEQRVKVTFGNDGIDKLAYTYTGVFPDSKTAEEESGRMTFEYNTYMGQQTSHDRSTLSPAFSPANNKLTVNLFMDQKYFDANTARLVFLTSEEYRSIAETKDIDELITKFEKIYKSKTFTCEVKK